MSDMNALELADSVEPLVLTSFHETQYIGRKAADMLRRQHEAIMKMRAALAVIQSKAGGTSALAYRVAEQALKDTEEFK